MASKMFEPKSIEDRKDTKGTFDSMVFNATPFGLGAPNSDDVGTNVNGVTRQSTYFWYYVAIT